MMFTPSLARIAFFHHFKLIAWLFEKIARFLNHKEIEEVDKQIENVEKPPFSLVDDFCYKQLH